MAIRAPDGANKIVKNTILMVLSWHWQIKIYFNSVNSYFDLLQFVHDF